MAKQQNKISEHMTIKDNLHQLLMTNLIAKQQQNDIIVNKAVAMLVTKMETMKIEQIPQVVETMQKIKEINNIEEYKEINEILKS